MHDFILIRVFVPRYYPPFHLSSASNKTRTSLKLAKSAPVDMGMDGENEKKMGMGWVS